MAADSKIEWCDHTFNPWIGCTKVSIAATGGGGCDHCYAEVSTPARVLRSKGAETWGTGAPRVRTSPGTWALPKRWNAQAEAFRAQHGRRQRVFCASLADVFDNAVDPAWRADLFAIMEATPNLDWLVLTKRIGNVRKMVPARWLEPGGWPAHVRIGATVVNQEEAERDIPKLLALPCPNFLSIEPLLAGIDLERPMPGPDLDQGGGAKICQPWMIQSGIDWVIVGGESGPGARPMHPAWARSLRGQCASAGVPFLFKQWGEWLPWSQFCDAGIDDPPEQTRFETREHIAGVWHDVGKPDYWATMDGDIDDEHCVGRVGKKAAGRTLDGRTWDQFPEARNGTA